MKQNRSTLSKAKQLYQYYSNALLRLQEGVAKSKDPLQIDGAIKRFELCYELAWKLIKQVLEDKGIICRNPRDSFKQAVLNELITQEEAWLAMLEDRNLLVHTYGPETSRELFEKIRSTYLKLFEELKEKVEEEDG